MQDKKTVQKIRDIARRYPEDFSSCRVSLGHSWKPIEAAWLQDGNIEQVLACTRCETRRVQTLDKHGYIVGRHYTYPDGFLMTGMGRLDTDGRAIFRLAAVRKLLGGK